MKSIGELLKNTRLEKGFSLEEIVHETNISRHFIEALEEEDFDAFPAEAYLLGFLRNYSDFLGLDPNKIVSMFKNIKLSEEPAPIEELVGRRREIPWKKIILLSFLAAVIVLAVIFVPGLTRTFIAGRNVENTVDQNSRVPQEFLVESDFIEMTIIAGDSVRIPFNDTVYTFLVQKKNKKIILSAEDPSLFKGREAAFSLGQGEEIFVSLQGDSPDLRIFLKGMDAGSGESVVQVQRLEKPNEEVAEAAGDLVQINEIVESVDSVEPPSGVSQRKVDKQIIYNAKKPESFTLGINFKGFCLFRYKADNSPPEEKYYKDGETFRLDVYRNVKIWGSNAGSIYAKIKDTEIPLGGAGEVTVRQILWTKNDDGTYDLVIIPVY